MRTEKGWQTSDEILKLLMCVSHPLRLLPLWQRCYRKWGDTQKKVAGEKFPKMLQSALLARAGHCTSILKLLLLWVTLSLSFSLSNSNFYGNPLFPWLGELMTSFLPVFILSAALNVYIILAYRTANLTNAGTGESAHEYFHAVAGYPQ